jgi:aminomethyltransferase
MSAMIKKSPFFEFFNRRSDPSFEDFLATSVEDQHYINWNGFLLANDYGDAELEYHAIRQGCAVFDVSPLRKIRVHGSGAGAFFDRLLTRPVSDLAPMRATYTVFCNSDGSLKDDAILYKFADDDYLMMPSDIDHSPYFESICRQCSIENVSFTECTDGWYGVAVQGPLSAVVLQEMGFDSVGQLRPFEVREYEFGGGAICIARMGFTADLGYECWLAPPLASALIEWLEMVRTSLNMDLPGYGLDALQACRLEGGFIVAGWDCSTEIDPQPGFERSPYELGLGWLVDLNGSDFVGKDALIEQNKNGAAYSLRYFSLDGDAQPPDGAEIVATDSDDVIGSVNCSNWSWGLQQTIGNASIKSEYLDQERGRVSIDGGMAELKLNRKPLLELQRRNQVPAPTDYCTT